MRSGLVGLSHGPAEERFPKRKQVLLCSAATIEETARRKLRCGGLIGEDTGIQQSTWDLTRRGAGWVYHEDLADVKARALTLVTCQRTSLLYSLFPRMFCFTHTYHVLILLGYTPKEGRFGM